MQLALLMLLESATLYAKFMTITTKEYRTTR